MLKRLFDQFVGSLSPSEPDVCHRQEREHAIRRATAVLMLDVALADKVFDPAEIEHLRQVAEKHFGLGAEEAADLIRTAKSEAEDLVSLHQFTHLLHHSLSDEEKARVVGALWEIAYADGRLDKYENALVLKISDLLYVSRGRVMRLKHDAKQGKRAT